MRKYKDKWNFNLDVFKVTSEVIASAYPRNWNEDYLTRSLLNKLRSEFRSTIIEKGNRPWCIRSCSWDVFKNTQAIGMEERHGDISILVKLDFGSERCLEGVAFLEAKMIYDPIEEQSTAKFKAIDWTQLGRLAANSSFHRTLLYDILEKEGKYFGRVLSIPTRHLLAINKTDRSVYEFSEHFSYSLTNRYFGGLELDFDPIHVEAAKGFIDTKGGVKYLIVSNVCMTDKLEPSVDSIKINKEIFERLKEPIHEPENDPSPSDFKPL